MIEENQNKYHNIVVDIYSLYYRAYYSSRHLTHKLSDGTRLVTGGIYASIQMLRLIQSKFLVKYGYMYCVFDSIFSGDAIRKQKDPLYEANRDEKKDPIFCLGFDYLYNILLNFDNRYFIIKKPNSEADDLAYPLAQNSELSYSALFVSNDFDWARVITSKVHLAKYEKNKNRKKDYVIYNQEVFRDKYGFDPEDNTIKLYKAFRGDKPNNIGPGVPFIKEDLLIKLINEFQYGTVDDIICGLNSLSYVTTKWKRNIKNNFARLKLNYNMVDCQQISTENLDDFMFPSVFKPNTLKILYASLGFKIVDDRVDLQKTDNTFFVSKKISRV